jgi:peptidoglycan/xylan/chitin deacetylase (PgdA/CDA1 family)
MSDGGTDGGTSRGRSTPADAGPSDAGQSRDAGSSSDAGTAVKRNMQLTFDDGPEPVKSALDPILAELEKRKVKAGFFVLGEEVKMSRGAIVAIQKASHVIGNHSWDHMMKGTRNYTEAQIYQEFEDTHLEVQKTGVIMEVWRTPRGEEAQRVEQILLSPSIPKKKALYTKTHCDWHADSGDAQSAASAEAMLRSIERGFASAAPLRVSGKRVWRLLFHVKPSTAKALPEVLDTLMERGGTFDDFSQ